MNLIKACMFWLVAAFGCTSFGQSSIVVPDSVRNHIDAEIDFIRTKIESYRGKTSGLVKLTCYLSKLYNKAGRYQEAIAVVDSLSDAEMMAAKGDVYLAMAINYKYQFEPEKSKYLFDRALFQFTLEENYCKQIEVHIELVEYYRKFVLIDLALKEAEEAARLLKIYDCDPLLNIRLLNRLAAVENYRDLRRSIRTSQQCIESCIKYKQPYYLAVSYNEIAGSYQHLNMPDSALYFFEKSEALSRSQGLIIDALHAKMNRLRMFSYSRVHVDEIIPGLIEIETEALQSAPNYDLLECYKRIWLEAKAAENWELAFIYYDKFYALESALANQKILEKIETVKQEEKESKTKVENFILSTQVERQNDEIKQKRNTIWLVGIALIGLLSVLIFLFRILRQRNALTKDLELRNQQKDGLIQEVHHRVKNNLSFISSLLEMQINSLPEETKTEELKNASIRIESMSLVHQMLYNQDDIGMIDLKGYLPELLSYLKDSLVSSHAVTVDLVCDEIKVESGTATAFGLIITEFVTNSFKHAFKGIENPKIEIYLQLQNNNICLTLKDNGVGMKSTPTSAKKGFGMRIIDIFSRQINAAVNFSYDQGTRLTAVMKYEK